MASTKKAFTGKHMALVFIGGFGVVIAVNLLMASVAVGSFHGTVVDNSYVASQNYNGWLAKAEASRALGWQAVPARRADGRVVLETIGLPAGAAITAEAERPLGERETASSTCCVRSRASASSVPDDGKTIAERTHRATQTPARPARRPGRPGEPPNAILFPVVTSARLKQEVSRSGDVSSTLWKTA